MVSQRQVHRERFRKIQTRGELTLLPREMDITLFDELHSQINGLKVLVQDLQLNNSELESRLERNKVTPSTGEVLAG